VVACSDCLVNLEDYTKGKSVRRWWKRKKGQKIIDTSKALANTLAMSETLTTLVSIFFFVL
jgi:hypothetical protein